ncbi:MAG: hypothetical protein WC974_09100 [Thermoplasmata archaeon]
MKSIVKIGNYNDLDFTEERISEIETIINNQVREGERVGMLVFDKILFMFEPVIWDFDNDAKIYPVKQITTLHKSVIEKPHLSIVK